MITTVLLNTEVHQSDQISSKAGSRINILYLLTGPILTKPVPLEYRGTENSPRNIGGYTDTLSLRRILYLRVVVELADAGECDLDGAGHLARRRCRGRRRGGRGSALRRRRRTGASRRRRRRRHHFPADGDRRPARVRAHPQPVRSREDDVGRGQRLAGEHRRRQHQQQLQHRLTVGQREEHLRQRQRSGTLDLSRTVN